MFKKMNKTIGPGGDPWLEIFPVKDYEWLSLYLHLTEIGGAEFQYLIVDKIKQLQSGAIDVWKSGVEGIVTIFQQKGIRFVSEFDGRLLKTYSLVEVKKALEYWIEYLDGFSELIEKIDDRHEMSRFYKENSEGVLYMSIRPERLNALGVYLNLICSDKDKRAALLKIAKQATRVTPKTITENQSTIDRLLRKKPITKEIPFESWRERNFELEARSSGLTVKWLVVDVSTGPEKVHKTSEATWLEVGQAINSWLEERKKRGLDS